MITKFNPRRTKTSVSANGLYAFRALSPDILVDHLNAQLVAVPAGIAGRDYFHPGVRFLEAALPGNLADRILLTGDFLVVVYGSKARCVDVPGVQFARAPSEMVRLGNAGCDPNWQRRHPVGDRFYLLSKRRPTIGLYLNSGDNNALVMRRAGEGHHPADQTFHSIGPNAGGRPAGVWTLVSERSYQPIVFPGCSVDPTLSRLLLAGAGIVRNRADGWRDPHVCRRPLSTRCTGRCHPGQRLGVSGRACITVR
jgi:hypothetical protein